MTVPPNVLAFLSIMLAAYVSSKTKKRAIYIIGAGGIAIVGYIILLTAKSAGGRYAGVLFAAAGVYTGMSFIANGGIISAERHAFLNL